MGHDARITFRTRRLAIRPGSGRTAWREARLAVAALVEERHRIDRRRALANLEVQLRSRDVSGLACLGDDLATLHDIVALDGDFARMGIGRDIAVAMPDQDQ